MPHLQNLQRTMNNLGVRARFNMCNWIQFTPSIHWGECATICETCIGGMAAVLYYEQFNGSLDPFVTPKQQQELFNIPSSDLIDWLGIDFANDPFGLKDSTLNRKITLPIAMKQMRLWRDGDDRPWGDLIREYYDGARAA